jgi:hypothetical protein
MHAPQECTNRRARFVRPQAMKVEGVCDGSVERIEGIPVLVDRTRSLSAVAPCVQPTTRCRLSARYATRQTRSGPRSVAPVSICCRSFDAF